MVFLCAANCTNTTTPESSTEPPDTTESDEDPTATSLFEIIFVSGAVVGLIVVSVNICIAMICILKIRKKRQQMNKPKISNMEMINYN